jgi:hypothetical protein
LAVVFLVNGGTPGVFWPGETADELRANSHLKAAEYAIPVLGLIFLKFADSRFTRIEAELAGKGTGRREIGKADYQAQGVLIRRGSAGCPQA